MRVSLPARRVSVGLILSVCLATATATAMATAADARPVVTPGPADACTLAVTDVSVVAMDGKGVQRHRSVLIAGNRILRITRRATGTRACARVVDGDGLYLLPGLNDFHMHVETTAFATAFGLEAAPVPFRAVLAPYLAAGITGVRVMSGAPDILEFRRSVQDAPGATPRIVVSSPMLSGDPPVLPEPMTRVVRTAEAAREAVREYAELGYDFIKVRDNLKADVFRAVIDEAAAVGLDVDGHTNRSLDIFRILESGQRGFAHLDELALSDSVAGDPGKAADLLRACDCYVSTAIGVSANVVAQIENYDAMTVREGVAHMHPMVVDLFWRKPNNPYLKGDASAEFFLKVKQRSQRLALQFNNRGVRLLAGSDALNPMLLPAQSLHEELALLAEAGLSAYDVLRTATVNGADSVPGFEEIGVIAPGYIANLILVRGNPLDDIAALRNPVGVIVDGHYHSRTALDRVAVDAEAQIAKMRNPPEKE